MGTTAVADDIYAALTGLGNIFRDRAPTGRMPGPTPYGILRISAHGNRDGLTALLDVLVDVYGYDDVAEVEAFADAIDGALRGRIVSSGCTALWLTSSTRINEDDPLTIRRQLAFNGTWASDTAALALEGGGSS